MRDFCKSSGLPSSLDAKTVLLDVLAGCQEIRCERSRGCLVYEFRGSLTFNGIPGILRGHGKSRLYRLQGAAVRVFDTGLLVERKIDGMRV